MTWIDALALGWIAFCGGWVAVMGARVEAERWRHIHEQRRQWDAEWAAFKAKQAQRQPWLDAYEKQLFDPQPELPYKALDATPPKC